MSMVSLLVRTSGDPDALTETVSRQVHRLDPNLPVYTRSMTELLKLSQFSSLFVSGLVGSFAAVALVLAVVGVYGVMLYSAGQRKHELGIRAALGAETGDLLRLLLRRGVAIVLCGLGAGVVGSLAVSRLLAGVLFDISPLEPAIMVAGAVALGVAALVACYLPVRWASRADPASALRCE
jgi:putative ABC transport system permease protein